MDISAHRKNIVLIGLSGTGKSSVARYIADKTGRELFDTDQMVVAKTGYPIAEIFQFKGEQYFRETEEEIIKNVSLAHSAVISCGGGVVLREENIKHLQLNGVLFCLWAELDELVKRLEGSEKRPLLTEDAYIQMKRLIHERACLYMVADYQINTQERTIENIGCLIIQMMSNHTGSA